MAGVSIEHLERVQWGAEYHWEVTFPDAPYPFNKFFPAIDVEENLYTVETYEIDVGVTSLSVPMTSKQFDIKITFLDNEEGLLREWLSDWVNKKIFKNNRVEVLSKVVKNLQVIKYTRGKKLVKSTLFRVYPKGSLFFHGSSESTATSYSAEFVVTEIVN